MSSEKMPPLPGNGSDGKLAILGGVDTLHLSLGRLPVELAKALGECNRQLAGWGDAALWMAKNRVASQDRKTPLLTLDNFQGPLLAIKSLVAAGQLDRLEGICFTGLKRCRELAASLGAGISGLPCQRGDADSDSGKSGGVRGAGRDAAAHRGAMDPF